MNHVYRLVWNRAMRMWQPVSELAAQPRGGAAPAAVYAPVRWRLHAVAAALGLGLAGWGPASLAACSTAGLTVTCTTSANPLMPYYSNAVNNLSVSLSESGSVGVLLGTGGPVSGGAFITAKNFAAVTPTQVWTIVCGAQHATREGAKAEFARWTPVFDRFAASIRFSQ